MIKLLRFLHIIDDRGKLDIIDLSFIAIMVKVIIAPVIDLSSIGAIVPVLVAKMQRTHYRSKTLDSE